MNSMWFSAIRRARFGLLCCSCCRAIGSICSGLLRMSMRICSKLGSCASSRASGVGSSGAPPPPPSSSWRRRWASSPPGPPAGAAGCCWAGEARGCCCWWWWWPPPAPAGMPDRQYSTARSGLLYAARRARTTRSRSKPMAMMLATTSSSTPIPPSVPGAVGVGAGGADDSGCVGAPGVEACGAGAGVVGWASAVGTGAAGAAGGGVCAWGGGAVVFFLPTMTTVSPSPTPASTIVLVSSVRTAPLKQNLMEARSYSAASVSLTEPRVASSATSVSRTAPVTMRNLTFIFCCVCCFFSFFKLTNFFLFLFQ
eukprot:PhM_4_TR17420/c0_g1_i1/m.78048